MRRKQWLIACVLLAGFAVLAIVIPHAWLLVAGLLIAYLLAGLYFSLAQSSTADLLTRVSLPFFTFSFHVCYGMGALVGLWSAVREPAHPKPARDTWPLHGETGAKLG